MRAVCAGLLAFLSCVPAIRAQLPSATAQQGSIAGIVIDADKNPVSRAIVTLSTTGANPQDAVAWTDASGRFAFAYLPPGQYALSARKAGLGIARFSTATRRIPTAMIQVRAGENRTDLVCRLPRMTSLAGTVLDASGNALTGANVTAFRPLYRQRERQWVPAANSQADAKGQYRFSNLLPGNYVICLRQGPAFDARSEASAKQAHQDGLQPVYLDQCYPGAEDPNSATIVTIQAGKDISGIDFRATLAPTAIVRGTVQLPDALESPDVRVNVTALKKGFAAIGIRMGGMADPRTREFLLQGLPVGTYTLTATAQFQGKQYRGTKDVTLQARATDDVTIILDRGIELSGTVQAVGPDAAKHAPQYVGLRGETPGTEGAPRGAVQPDGTFKIENVTPGTWAIDAGPIPHDGYVKSAMLGKQDVLAEEMIITRNTSAPLNIVISTKGAVIKGDVVDASQQPAVGMVILAPEGKVHGVTSFYRWIPTDDQGHYEFTGIRPGSYKIYALDEFDMNVHGPEGLEPFAQRGVRVDLTEGQPASQKLTLIATSPGVGR